ncbi:type II toxin-antitoxin system HigB family toxin [Treponema sp. HNW]|uniref:type II toxin-antitoxin system HigB family toxin n=1 Tax=Treponema sp. HNW TaxID=3116654 RepID=UPI003D0B867F
MRIIARKTLAEYWIKHPSVKSQLQSWFKETEKSDWQGPDDIKKRYPSASFLADNRVCFNIGGNNYRLIVKINYDFHIVYIRFIGTHAEYDKINAGTV